MARELCRRLLLSGPDELLNKMPAVITLGTPLEGARIGNLFLRYAPLSKKIRQLTTPKYAFAEYRHAIREAENRKVRRPKQLHVQMEDDRVIKKHVDNHFTKDDVVADVIPGGHTNFADDNDDASYIADVLLRHIRKAYTAISRPAIRPPVPVAEVELPDQLVLIACSHGKRDGGVSPFAGPAPVAGRHLRKPISLNHCEPHWALTVRSCWTLADLFFRRIQTLVGR